MRRISAAAGFAAATFALAACAENDGSHEHAPFATELSELTAIEIPVAGEDFAALKAWRRAPRIAGADRRRIIIIPGAPSDVGYWGGEMTLLDPYAEIIAVERPGYNGSGPDRAVVDLYEQARAIGAIVRGYDGGLTLIGHSFGASVALAGLAEYGAEIDRLVLISPYVYPVAGRKRVWLNIVAGTPARFIGGVKTHRFFRELGAQERHSRAILEIARRNCAPTIVVHGLEDDLVPLKDAARFAAVLPECANPRFEVIKGADHYMSVHAARALATIINAFAEAVAP